MLRFAITGLEVPYFHDVIFMWFLDRIRLAGGLWRRRCRGRNQIEMGIVGELWILSFFVLFYGRYSLFIFLKGVSCLFSIFPGLFKIFQLHMLHLPKTGDISLVLFRDSHWGRCWWPPTTDTPSNGPSKRWPSWQWDRLMWGPLVGWDTPFAQNLGRFDILTSREICLWCLLARSSGNWCSKRTLTGQDRVGFGQLMGMADHLTYTTLGSSGVVRQFYHLCVHMLFAENLGHGLDI